jgi:hypothetical protein
MAEAVVKDGRAYMRDESGAAFSVPVEDVDRELAAGARLEAPDEYSHRQIQRERSTLGQKAITAGEGALRGATLGLGTAALAELGGEEYRQAALERAEINPVEAGVGEFAGMVAPTLVSGGSGLVARGVGAVGAPARMAARAGALGERAVEAGARALGYAGEGTLARALVSGAKMGTGGAIEGAAYGLGSSLADSALEGTEWTAERALSGLGDGALYGLLGGAAVGASGSLVGSAGKRVVSAMTDGKPFRQAVREFADKRVVKSVIGNDIKTFRKLTNDGANMGALEEVAVKMRERRIPLDDHDAARRALNVERQNAGKVMGDVAAELDTAGVRANIPQFLERVDARLADIRASGVSGNRRLADRVERQLEPYRLAAEEGRDVAFTRLWKDSTFIRKLDEEAAFKRNPAAEQWTKLYQDMRTTLDEAVDGAAPDLGAKWKAAERDYAQFSTLHEGARREGQRRIKNRWTSPSDYGVGGVTGNLIGTLAGLATGSIPLGAVAGLVTGSVASAAHKLVRERGSAAISRLADRVASVEMRADTAARVLAGLDNVRKLPVRGAIVAATSKDRAERFQQVRETVLRAQRNPATLATLVEERIAPLAAEQPEVAFAMGRRIAEDYAWLATKMPQPYSTFGKSLQPHLDPPIVPPHEQAKIVRYAEALADPPSVLEDMARGQVNWAGIEALKERRPDVWEGMRFMVATRVAESGTKLEYRKRILYSLAFEFTGDPMLESVGDLQATGVVPPEPSSGNVNTKALETTTEQQTPYQQAMEAA